MAKPGKAAPETKALLSPAKNFEDDAPSTCCGDPLWSPKAMYTVFNMGQSAFVNYIAVFLEHTAMFSKFQIGVLQTLPSICSFVGPPFWCAIADKYHCHRWIHIMSIATGAILLYAVHYTTNYWLVVALITLGNFQMAPAGSLLDHAILNMLSKYGGEYGKQRLFGAVGWGIGAYVAGLVVAVGGISWAFHSSLAFNLASLYVLRQIPMIAPKVEEPEPSINEGDKPKKLERKSSFSEAMSHLAHQTDVIVLMAVVFFLGLMYGVLSSFLTLNLYNISGQNAQIIGVAIVCETASELPAFFYSQAFIDKLGTVKVLLVSIAGYALRITYYAFMTNAWSAIPFEFLHGLTFGIMWAAVTQYLYKAAPRGTEGTVMGLLNAILNGAGRGGGTLIGGYFYEHYGARTMWLITDLGVPLSLLGVAAFAYLQKPVDSLPEDEEAEEVVALADMFSPHSADPTAMTSPRTEKTQPSYNSV